MMMSYAMIFTNICMSLHCYRVQLGMVKFQYIVYWKESTKIIPMKLNMFLLQTLHRLCESFEQFLSRLTIGWHLYSLEFSFDCKCWPTCVLSKPIKYSQSLADNYLKNQHWLAVYGCLVKLITCKLAHFVAETFQEEIKKNVFCQVNPIIEVEKMICKALFKIPIIFHGGLEEVSH